MGEVRPGICQVRCCLQHTVAGIDRTNKHRATLLQQYVRLKLEQDTQLMMNWTPSGLLHGWVQRIYE